MNDFNFFRLSYHQFLVENIPEGLHSVLPAVPTPNYRYSDEEGMNNTVLHFSDYEDTSD